MDNTTFLLIICQIFTIVLLMISESLPMSSSPYSGILHAIITQLAKNNMNEENK